MFSPRTGRHVLIGFLAGLVLWSVLGHRAAHLNYHRDFTRFYPHISPEALYYPTVQEMCSIVRARCRPDQVLVIVGGNSIFFGVSQPPGEVWSQRLQEDLGPGFCVINFAMRGASPTDGGAVVAEVLRKEFPHQIYVTDEAPAKAIPPCGSEVYGFIFWEAYYKGWLENYRPRRDYVDDVFFPNFPGATPPRWQLYALAKLDQALAFRDFWNWISYDYLFTVAYSPDERFLAAFAPKKNEPDTEFDGEQLSFAQRFRPETWDAEMRIVRGFTEFAYQKNSRGEWQMYDAVKADILRDAALSMSENLRHRTLMVVCKNSPFFVRKLNDDERRRNELGLTDSIALWKQAGYDAMTFPETLVDEDFHDRTHLLAPGGKKLADAVAPEVHRLAETLGYLKP